MAKDGDLGSHRLSTAGGLGSTWRGDENGIKELFRFLMCVKASLSLGTCSTVSEVTDLGLLGSPPESGRNNEDSRKTGVMDDFGAEVSCNPDEREAVPVDTREVVVSRTS